MEGATLTTHQQQQQSVEDTNLEPVPTITVNPDNILTVVDTDGKSYTFENASGIIENIRHFVRRFGLDILATERDAAHTV